MSVNGDSSSERSSSCTNSGSENSDEACLKCFDGEIKPYAFEPVDDTISDTDTVTGTDGEIDMEVEESSEDSDDENRLQNKDWLVQMQKPSFS